jgi:hypothetical protein
MRRGLLCLAAFLICGLAGAAGSSAEDKSIAGTWEGAVVWSPGQVEIDLIIDFAPDGKGGWGGKLAAPTASTEGNVLGSVAVQGRTVSFEHLERPARGKFKGTLADDGTRIEGDFSPADGSAGTRFELHRRRGNPTAAAEVRPLSGPEELRDLFNFDNGSPRLVLLLSPTCELCRVGARLTERYVLQTVSDPRLRIYTIWLPISDDDTRVTAARAAGDLYDSRVRHFWTADRSIAQTFAKTLGIKQGPAWDVFLVYGPEASWQDPAVPPAPRYYMHRSGELPQDQTFDGRKLADAVRAALAAAKK